LRKRLRILVVDDDDLILESLRSELGEQYEVLCATRASEAMSIFGREEVDCVISDVRMPGTDGITLLKEVGSRNPFVGFETRLIRASCSSMRWPSSPGWSMSSGRRSWSGGRGAVPPWPAPPITR